jgi:hypothetical protein
MAMPTCKHCKKQTRLYPRKLCWRCYHTPEIVEKYPKNKTGNRKGFVAKRDPAKDRAEMERLEQLIETRRHTMPLGEGEKQRIEGVTIGDRYYGFRLGRAASVTFTKRHNGVNLIS